MIIMKLFSITHRIFAGALLIALGTLASCKKLIEIPINPPTQIIRDQVFTDSATTMTAVAGVYSYTPGGRGIPYSDGVFNVVTALSAREVSSADGEKTQFFNYSVNPLNVDLKSLWADPYAEIYQVNDILERITNNNNLSVSFVKQITGEMKVVRAFVYFNLLNLFGGVPLITSTDYKTNAQLPRATASEIYAQIMMDLNDAMAKLTVNYPSNGHARANFYTAQALLAKVHLYQANWKAAYDEANSVITQGGFTLEEDLDNVFLNGSKEAIWQVPIQNQYGGSGDADNFVPYSSSEIPKFVVTAALKNQFETGDQRLSKWVGLNVVNGQPVYYPAKYKDKQPTNPETGYVLLRVAEMHLIRAEAAAQLNRLKDAMDDVNLIRDRADLGLSMANSVSQTEVLAAVKKERQTELCFEFGNRWFDLNRTSTDNKYPANGQAPAVLAGWQPNFAVYPLPQSQLQLNGNLKQNPDYH
jgi:hypothetical protein